MPFEGGCSSATANRSWPVPLCPNVDVLSLQERWPALNATTLAALAAVHTEIQAASSAALRASVFGRVTTAPDLVWEHYNGLWAKARLYARRLHAAMLAEHGCAIMCADDILGGGWHVLMHCSQELCLLLLPSPLLPTGVGATTAPLVTILPQTASAATLTGSSSVAQSLLLYVQRRRTRVVCDGAGPGAGPGMTIPWTRRDPAEVWQGETSTLDVSASLAGLSFGSLTTPV